jgi:serine/threonine protein kinase/Tol biopolymer transport system component
MEKPSPAPHRDTHETLPDDRGATEPLIPASLRRSGRVSSSRPAPEEDPMIGREVDHYRVLGHLGGGGMGVVYKAEDTRLQRIVALKFLPPAMTRDPVAKSRFLQEARAASALDHPNVCTIYDIGEVEDGQLYLAMPAYDGETLKKRIERGPLPAEEAVDIAKQAAQGLAKAHRQGIVHRDIKPANLMLTGDGIVKILDFGLAKLAGSAGLTRAGFCVGTPSYMSPEQARGEVDPRTDLWSLGVVLYEMLTGLLPFRAESDPGIVHAVIHDEPTPLTRWQPDVPPELERIVLGLLQKDPGGRYPTAENVLADLRALGGPPTRSQLSTEIPRPGEQRRWGAWAAVAAVVAVAAMAGVAAVMLRPRPADEPIVQETVQLTRQVGSERQPAFGGDFFVYTKLSGGDSDLFWQRVDGENPRNLTEDSPADDSEPAVSPDGSQIAFHSERDGGGIFVMGSTGESARRLTDSGHDPAWSPDASELAIAAEGITKPGLRNSISQLWRIRMSDGAATLLKTGDAVQPSWSPGGQRIAYWGISVETGRRSIWTTRKDSRGDPVEVIGDERINYWRPIWSPDGRHLYFLSDRGGSMNVWRVRIEEGSGRVLGEPAAVAARAKSVSGLSLSRDGHRILYATDESVANVERVELDPVSGEVSGGLKPITSGSWSVRSADISSDGEWIAFDTQAPQEELFVVRASGGEPRQLTRDTYKDRIPRWSPEDGSMVFYSNRSGKYEAWKIRADGSGLTQLTKLQRAVYNPVWSPDGRRLALNLGSREGAVLDLDGPLERRRSWPIAEPGRKPDAFAPDSWSPDGRWLVGYRTEPGIHLYSFATRRFRKLIDSGTYVSWLHDNRRLLYVDQGRLQLFDLVTRTSRDLIAPPSGSSFQRVSVSRDDRTLCLVRTVDEGDISMLTLK